MTNETDKQDALPIEIPVPAGKPVNLRPGRRTHLVLADGQRIAFVICPRKGREAIVFDLPDGAKISHEPLTKLKQTA